MRGSGCGLLKRSPTSGCDGYSREVATCNNRKLDEAEESCQASSGGITKASAGPTI